MKAVPPGPSILRWSGCWLGILRSGKQSEAERLLTDGDRLAWLKNWQAAEPFFERAEINSARAATGETNSTLRSAGFGGNCRSAVFSKPQPSLIRSWMILC